MKIRQVECIPLSLNLKKTYRIAYESFSKVENLFIRLDCGGLSGWGCAAPDFHVTGERIEQLQNWAENNLLALLEGKDPFRRGWIMDRLKKECPRCFSLWAAVDMALWDLLGKKADLPLWKILGGYRNRIQTSVTIGICSSEETIEEAEQFISQGFRILKIKGGLDPDVDLERLYRLRELLGKGIRLRFDANQGYSLDQAKFFIKNLGNLNLELLEQPTSGKRLEELGQVTRISETPVMADESLLSLVDAFHLVKKGWVDLLNIKLMKTGGIAEAVQVDSVARAGGIEVMVGCMDESALGISAGLHFALSRKNIRYTDLDGHLDILEDPAKGILRLSKGYLYPSSLPGLGWKGL